MYYDLNIPWPGAWPSAASSSSSAQQASQPGGKKKARGGGAPSSQQLPQGSSTPGKGKGKGTQPADPPVDPLSTLDDTAKAQVTEVASDLLALGYSTVAYNLVVATRYDPALHPNPFAPTAAGRPTVPFPALDSRFPRSSSSSSASCASSASLLTSAVDADRRLTQLSRLTVTLTDVSLQPPGHGILTSHAQSLMSWDLLSVRPTTEATFQHACLTLSELKPFSIDIIALDLSSSPRLPWLLKRSTIHAALENGVMFEVAYSPALAPPAGATPTAGGDPTSHLRSRRNLISNTRDLLRITNGRGVIFSSAAADALALRGPYDVINLASVFGMSAHAARDAITDNCRQLLVRASTRKSFRGVVGPPVLLAPASPVHSAKPHLDLDPSDTSNRKRKSDGPGKEDGSQIQAQPLRRATTQSAEMLGATASKKRKVQT